MPPRTDVFVCYAREDYRFRKLLRDWLRRALEARASCFWSDEDLPAGKPFRDGIEEAIARSRIAVLLESIYFHNSDFIREFELPRLWAAQSSGLTVLTVKIMPVVYTNARIDSLHKVWDAPPLGILQGKARVLAVNEICRKILEVLNLPPTPAPPLPTDQEDLNISIEVRGSSEAKGADTLLETATEARFIAMTYKSLREALTLGHITLPNLKLLEIGVYALPVLRDWHPTLREKQNELAAEWRDGLHTVLMRVTDRTCAPQLQAVDLRIINRPPDFTASQLTGTDHNQSIVRIRHTRAQSHIEMVNSETLVIARNASANKKPNVVFDYFAKNFDNTRASDRSMLFPIMRAGNPRYVREDLDDLVKRLESVTNLKQYELPDAKFHVSMEISPNVLKEALPARKHDDPVGAVEVYAIFNFLRSDGRADRFSLTDDPDTFAAPERKLRIRIGCEDKERIEFRLTDPHIVGVFALLVGEQPSGRTIFLKKKPKPAWSHDVPGGKVAAIDESRYATLDRELFEELGLCIRKKHVGEIAAVKYDPGGALVGCPVVAIYVHYRLGPDEQAYLEEILPNATDGYPLVAYDIQQLINEKQARRVTRSNFEYPGFCALEGKEVHVKDTAEAVCHAPLEAIQELLT